MARAEARTKKILSGGKSKVEQVRLLFITLLTSAQILFRSILGIQIVSIHGETKEPEKRKEQTEEKYKHAF